MSSVSVILPVYNRAGYVKEAIQSVLDQSYAPKEVIVVDDGSTDATPDVIRSFGDAITYVRQENTGAGAARNAGILRASEDFVSFIDSDDLWPSHKIERQVRAFDERPELDLVFGFVEQFICPSLSRAERDAIACPAEPMPGFHVGTMLARAAVFEKVGLFETDWEVGEFVSWFARAKEENLKIEMLRQVALRRRIHTSNMVIERRDSYSDFAKILKASIDRKRRRQSGGGTRL